MLNVCEPFDVSIPQMGIFLKELVMDMPRIELYKRKILNNINVQQCSIAIEEVVERHLMIWRDVCYMLINKRKA